MITLPKPALVLFNPSAKKPWKHEASIRPKRIIEIQAIAPAGCFFPLEAPNQIRSNPAGISLTDATNIGPALGNTPFMATIAVPQRKKGLMRSKVSKILYGEAIGASSLSFCFFTCDRNASKVSKDLSLGNSEPLVDASEKFEPFKSLGSRSLLKSPLSWSNTSTRTFFPLATISDKMS
ncbi:hypothetical protein Mapa_011892 [Marchantia paleacea]|nr:hypothetical protein Mapa_011892 [Marchantia paleacea]